MEFVPQADRVRFILVEPSHPGNIGAAARAIHTMGFRHLWVVKPKDPQYRCHPDAIAFATNSAEILEQSCSVTTLVEALDGVTHAFALSGYDREYGPPIADLKTCIKQAREHLSLTGSQDIAFVFGTERSGLTNEQMDLCQTCCAIPANPECDSLNLSQAVQVTAYEAQLGFRGENSLGAQQQRFTQDAPATVKSIEGFFSHFEEAMLSCGALDPTKPKFMMPRIRHLFGRTGLTQIEIDLLRGICSAIIRPKAQRVGEKQAKIAAQKANKSETNP